MTERALHNRGEILRVYLDEYRGRHSLQVRRWYPGENGGLLPGKGASVPPHLIPFVRRAIVELERDALRRGLIGEQDYELIGEAA